MYFKRAVIIPNYGFTVNIFEPNVMELHDLEEAWNKWAISKTIEDWQKIAELWAKQIDTWDVTDRKDQKLEVTPENVATRPTVFIKALMDVLPDAFQGKPNPKPACAS